MTPLAYRGPKDKGPSFSTITHHHLLRLTQHGEDHLQLLLPHLHAEASHKDSARYDDMTVLSPGHGGCRRQGGREAGLYDWLGVGERGLDLLDLLIII